ncbi:hypothetical protein [Photobacterium marinum]|uniref:hypothetical protein n=1 Tax=Photobacterium marinum TaxID=1056511 RepID=UPI0012FA325C|nr:hypothetical protein [Photobacterium marinum]
MKLYRDMRVNEKGLPELGYTSSTLGVRICGCTVDESYRRPDILVNEHGFVEPLTGGLSITPPEITKNISDMSADRINRGKTLLWMIDVSVLSKYGLKFRQDPDKVYHGFIEPIEIIVPFDYNKNIQSTQCEWEVCHELQSE